MQIAHHIFHCSVDLFVAMIKMSHEFHYWVISFGRLFYKLCKRQLFSEIYMKMRCDAMPFSIVVLPHTFRCSTNHILTEIEKKNRKSYSADMWNRLFVSTAWLMHCFINLIIFRFPFHNTSSSSSSYCFWQFEEFLSPSRSEQRLLMTPNAINSNELIWLLCKQFVCIFDRPLLMRSICMFAYFSFYFVKKRNNP